MSVVVGVLVAVAVVVLPAPAAGRLRVVAGPGWMTGPGRASVVGRSARSGLAGASGRPGAGRGSSGAPRGAAGGRRRAAPEDLASVLHAVSARVRAGAPPGAAWGAVLGQTVTGDVPAVEALTAVVGDRSATRARARAVVAGAHVAAETGAPLADVLEHLADAVAADAEQAGELESALAGPRATARVLAALPVLGLLVGAGMGARPWDVLTDGGFGSAVAVTGVGLLVAGQVWVQALLRRAAAP
ncbi:conserved hypothetical protein [Cellulomonas flavigena DSM 20109]|uniref:Type II secretion system protein GspF domain-containing protein n=1 Tax=Cellulomonas flavigena (strain ATCC 482 / DSM 20109 / BCRC 11376 / JCM 18109 / NBRC 3775 / NCIMB 8073 / NRS 134) TaxID=446466 RepID=D5UJM3_CELFN|nr:type II secretion system F family protein [Cellulomonas flavigena]ADG75661.1 conserved hypothetical protein [Cellulomonas flavigena DSM 20109]